MTWPAEAISSGTVYLLRVTNALRYLDEMPCLCKVNDKGVLLPCTRHELEDILRGTSE